MPLASWLERRGGGEAEPATDKAVVVEPPPAPAPTQASKGKAAGRTKPKIRVALLKRHEAPKFFALR